MNKWKEVPFNELGEVNRGKSRHRPRYAEHLYGGPYPFIQTGDIRGANGRVTSHTQTYSEAGLEQSRLWPANTMCITIAANIAETALLTYPACFPDSVVGFIADDTKCDVRFIEYSFRLLKKRLQSEAIGSVQDNINLATLSRVNILLPDLIEQKAIVQILVSLDDKIELNRQINETLEAMAQALFKSWFVDFDPVIDNALAAGNPIPDVFAERAKQRAAAKKPENQSTSATAVNDSSNYQHLFPAEFEFTEEMGWIPLGWNIKSVEESLLINPRITLKKGSTAKFADMKALPTAGYSINEVIFKEYSGGAKFQKGDVLFARITPCLENGKTGIAYFLDDEEVGFGSTEFIVMRGRGGIDTPFVACLARDENFRIHAQQSMVGSSGRQRVQAACFSSYFLALPNGEGVLEQFHEMANPSFQKALKSSKESETLTKLRDTLLPKLLSGELRIPDAEKLVQEALL